MRILPVLDLKAGQVVRGRAGRRQEYQPIRSPLCSSARPVEVAQAFRDGYGLGEVYVADLDAIAGAPPDWGTYAALLRLGFSLWVDAGVRGVADATRLAAAGIGHIVLGLETLQGPDALTRICQQLSGAVPVFSLDLKEGQPLGNITAWAGRGAEDIAARASAAGVRSMIVLDLARVGIGSGVGTEDLCARLTARHPEVEFLAGGGVRSVDDVHRLAQCGVRGVLLASVLHDEKISRADLDGLKSAVG